MRAIIVGGGIMGLCTAWALCRSGHDVVLYEQGPIPNPLASSYDEHRLDPLHLRRDDRIRAHGA